MTRRATKGASRIGAWWVSMPTDRKGKQRSTKSYRPRKTRNLLKKITEKGR